MRLVFAAALLAVVLALAPFDLLASGAAPSSSADSKLRIESSSLVLELDPIDGGIRSTLNKLTGLPLFRKPGLGPGCIIRLRDGTKLMPPTSGQFKANRRDGKIESLSYDFPQVGVELVVRVAAGPASEAVVFRPVLKIRGETDVESVVFPILSGMTSLGESSEDDYLAHPSASGLLVSDPLNTLRPGQVDHFESRFVHSEYPDGYYGCPLQFLTFYDANKGGFYFGCHDPTHTAKELNFHRAFGKDYLEMSLVHFTEGRMPGKLGKRECFGYPVVISSTRTGCWHEAAGVYRGWVSSRGEGTPVWCRDGPNRNKPSKQCARWLHEKTGLATFGISSGRDQSAWLSALHQAVGAPAFHVLGFDWERIDNSASDAGYEDIEKGRVHPANVRAIRSSGDRFAVFKVDLWLSTQSRDYAKLRSGDTGHHFKDGGKTKVWMCPASADWADFYVFRDKTLVSDSRFGCDALYNDISVCCAAPLSCLNPKHGHPVGGKGGWIVTSWRDLLSRSHEACSAEKRGVRVPIGTELITENFVDLIDFCHSRAVAGLQGAFEWSGDTTGKVTKIPMFDYVYHEYGPVRMDGLGKLGRRFGDIFYLIAAQTYLWGGILELDYEFSSPELFKGMTGPTDYLTYDYWTDFIRDESPERAHGPYLEFLRRMVSARLGFGRDFLCWGRMVPPLAVSSELPRVRLDYDHYNVFRPQDKQRAGAIEVASLVSSGWEAEGRLGFFFANISEKELKVTCKFESAKYGLKRHGAVGVVSGMSRRTLGVRSGDFDVTLTLPPHDVIMLDVQPIAAEEGSRANEDEEAQP